MRMGYDSNKDGYNSDAIEYSDETTFKYNPI